MTLRITRIEASLGLIAVRPPVPVRVLAFNDAKDVRCQHPRRALTHHRVLDELAKCIVLGRAGVAIHALDLERIRIRSEVVMVAISRPDFRGSCGGRGQEHQA